MRISIIVGPEGVERVVSIGPGLLSTKESLEFYDAIWSEVQDFNRAVVRKFNQSRKSSAEDPGSETPLSPSKQPRKAHAS